MNFPRSQAVVRHLLGLTVLAVLWSAVAVAQDLLPDLIVSENDLYDHDVVTNIVPGRVHLRLSNGTPNIGEGKLYLEGVLPPLNDSVQLVNQRVYRQDGTYWERPAGQFVYHPQHLHIHFAGWAIYRIREVQPGDSVGAIVAEGEKTSFCILDSRIHDSSLPNYNPLGEFFSCISTVQGLSVGWLDIYSKILPDQWIDITGVPDGIYWLESEVDPDNGILELDETNNVTRIKVVIGAPEPVTADAYEPNNSIAETDGRPTGGEYSPNLGPCNPAIVIAGLNIHMSGNDDVFRCYANHTGTASDYIQIAFSDPAGDLDMQLLDSAGSVVTTSQGVTDIERISLDGRPEGWCYVRVYGYNGAVNPDYTLTIDPPSNSPPSITTVVPPAGDIIRAHSAQTFTTEWSASDPEGDLAWVSVYANNVPAFDGDEIYLPASQHTDANVGFHVINSAYLNEGTYWIYCEITDGGTTAGDWSDGTVTFVEAVDSDSDGIFDFEDNCPHFPNPGQIGCASHGDVMGEDGVFDALDLSFLIDHVFFDGLTPPEDSECPAIDRGDLNCDGFDDAVDVSYMIDLVFFNGAPPCAPCACLSYPTDCP